MIFNRFRDVATNYSSKDSINGISYGELLERVQSQEYKLISDGDGESIIVDVLVAAKHNKPIVILPKFKKEDVVIPDVDNSEFSIYMFSSGSSTGTRKIIRMPSTMIEANAVNAIKCQSLTSDDAILTVCSINHTGGLSVQTLPGLLTGCSITIKPFNAFTFFKDLADHTVTHLIPIMMDGLFKVKNKTVPKSLRLVVAGSDCIKRKYVEFWNNNNVPFIANYGMTEAGPVIINHKFCPGESLNIFDKGVPLGDTLWCDAIIAGSELLLKGDCINTDTWLRTGDCVEQFNGWYMYKGRLSAGCKIIPKQY